MSDDLMKRVQRALGNEAQPKLSAPKRAAAPTPLLVRFQMWCSVENRPFVVVAERRDDKTLALLRNELPGAGAGTGAGSAAPMSTLGSFRFLDGGWPGCPLCGAKHNRRKNLSILWCCDNAGCGSQLHCVGDRGGLFRCACGIAADYDFTPVPVLPVRGAAADNAPKSASAMGRAAREALSASPTMRLTFKGK